MEPTPLGQTQRRTKYSVPAVEKALDVLEYLSDQAVPATQAQLARALGRQPGEIFRMLTCLELRGYLRRDRESGGYALSLKLFELSRTHSPYEDLLKCARPWMRRLTEEVHESCHLSVLHHDRVLVLAQEENPRPFRLSVEVGSMHSPLHTTSGRVLLAHLTDTERDAMLRRIPEWGGETGSAKGVLMRRLRTIRAAGHDRSEGERFIGALDLGVLAGTLESSIQAALTITTLRHKRGPDLDAILPRLVATAAAITAEAGLTNRKRLA